MNEITEEMLANGDMKIEGKCISTKEPHEIIIPKASIEGYYKWRYDREPLTKTLPNMSRDDREFLITGYTPKGWAQDFGTLETDGM